MIPALLPQLTGDTQKYSGNKRLRPPAGGHVPPPYIPLPILRLDDQNDTKSDTTVAAAAAAATTTTTRESCIDAIESNAYDGDSNNDVGSEIVIGRRDIIIALSSFCRCLEESVKEVPSDEREQSTMKRFRSFRPSSKCVSCTFTSSWIKRIVSMKMLRFNVNARGEENRWSIELLGVNEKVVFVNGQELKKGPEGAMTIGLGSQITLCNSLDGEMKKNHEENVMFTVGLVKKENLLDSCSTVENQIGAAVTSWGNKQATCNTSMLQDRQQEENDHGKWETSNSNKDRNEDSSFHPVQVQHDASTCIVECTMGENHNETGTGGIETRNHDTSSVQNTATNASQSRPSLVQHEHLQHLQNEDVIDLISLDEDSIVEGGHVSKVNVDDNTTFSPKATEDNNNIDKHEAEAIFFLQRGQQMSKTRVSFLTKAIQSNRNELQIQTTFDKSDPPKYIVIDPNLSLETAQKELGFQDLNEMANVLEKVHLVKPEWIIQCTTTNNSSVEDMVAPTISQCWSGTFALHSSREASRNRQRKALCVSNNVKKRKMSNDSASEENSPMKHSTSCHNRGSISIQNQQRNLELSLMFERISKLYSDCPLSLDDTWRSYSYNIVSKRLQYLDFEVTHDTDCLKRLASVKGFGSKVLTQCKEFLTTGKCQLIREFEHDDRRLAVRNMTKIWGVGPAKAWELVDMGYRNILDVRRALEVKELDLSAGARVGVEFYEDFQEKMNRFEVRRISKIVEEAVKKIFPTAEVMTMGSYRRGKQLCGDVDILITHRDYTRTVPLGALDELVERLKSKGHISHHLTRVDTKHFQAMLSLDAGESHSSIFPSHTDSQSYMGVFNSPSLKGKRRRIDIKFYPYRQKAFAMMYFTGNGYFNRSIRLYAKRRKNCRLTDHGLFPEHLGGAKSLKAKDEHEVFDKLGLVYKEPKDRDGFDAVVEKESNQVFTLEDVNKSEIMTEEKIARDLKWVD